MTINLKNKKSNVNEAIMVFTKVASWTNHHKKQQRKYEFSSKKKSYSLFSGSNF